MFEIALQGGVPGGELEGVRVAPLNDSVRTHVQVRTVEILAYRAAFMRLIEWHLT